MGITHSAPQYNATRRIKWLLFAFMATTLACIAGWFIVAKNIDTQLSEMIEQRRATGETANCDNQMVRGFPFRFGVFCDAASFANTDISVNIGAIRSAAQFYNPTHVIIEADSPLQLRTRSNNIIVTWDGARTSIIHADPLPRRLSIEIKQPRMETPAMATMGAEALTAHMRHLNQTDDRGGQAGDMEIAMQITAPDLSPLLGKDAVRTPFNLDIDATLKQLAARYVSGERATLLTNTGVIVHRAAVLLSNDSGLLVDGTLSTDARGLISGVLTVRLVDVDAVINGLTAAFPLKRNIIALLNNLPRSGTNSDEASLTLILNKGLVSFGFIPIGTLPPLI